MSYPPPAATCQPVLKRLLISPTSGETPTPALTFHLRSDPVCAPTGDVMVKTMSVNTGRVNFAIAFLFGSLIESVIIFHFLLYENQTEFAHEEVSSSFFQVPHVELFSPDPGNSVWTRFSVIQRMLLCALFIPMSDLPRPFCLSLF
jgi:hypothetical protein